MSWACLATATVANGSLLRSLGDDGEGDGDDNDDDDDDDDDDDACF